MKQNKNKHNDNDNDNDKTDKMSFNKALEHIQRLRQQQSELQNRVTPTMIKTDSTPSKRQTKLRGPITRGAKVSFGSESARWSLAFLIRAVAASETGCRTATNAELERIQNSARNCNTTQRSSHAR